MKVEGTVKNTLKKGWNRKEGRRNKTFTKGGILGPGVGALKRGGRWLEPPYELWLIARLKCSL